MSNHLKKTSVKPLLLMLIFILPMIMSWILFHYHENFHFKTTNHGILFNPPLNLTAINFGTNQKKWKMVFVSESQCDSQCHHVFYELQQIQKAMGKNRDRVTTMQLLGENNPLKTAFSQQQSFTTTNKVFLIDPNNNLFMYYPSTTNPMNILKDLKKVLEVSQIG